MKLPDDKPTKDQDIVDRLNVVSRLISENSYLKGKIAAYEKFLKDKGFIEEEE